MLELGNNWEIIYHNERIAWGIADPSSNQYAWGSLMVEELYWGIQ